MIILQASQRCILIEIKHIMILIFEIVVTPPTMCRLSMNLPELDLTSHHAQQWVTPELGLSSTQGKGILYYAEVTGKLHSAIRRILSRSLLMPTTHGLSFPTCLFHQDYTPSQAFSIGASPPSLGLGNRPDQEFSELCSW